MRPNSWHAYLPGIGVDLAEAMTVSAAEGSESVRRSPQSPVVVRNLSRSLIHVCSPRCLSTFPGLLSRSETWDHVHWGDVGLLPGEAARWSRKWARHLRQGTAAQIRARWR